MSFFRLTMPGFPAYVLLAACVVFLIPGLGRTWRPRADKISRLRPTRALVAAVAVLAAYPLVAVALMRPASASTVAQDNGANLLVPIAGSLHLEARSVRGVTDLSWDAPAAGRTEVWYAIYRATTDGCTPPFYGPKVCEFSMPLIAVVRGTHWQTTPGTWTYRVGVLASPVVSDRGGDVLMLSPAVRTS
jgi:hypothetical protein